MRLLPVMLIAACALLLVFASGCKTLALSGKEKYKVDMNNIFSNMIDEVKNEGRASDKTVTKLENLLEAYREEFSNSGSFIEAEKALESMKLAQSEPERAFQHSQQALMHGNSAQEFLKTETDS